MGKEKDTTNEGSHCDESILLRENSELVKDDLLGKVVHSEEEAYDLYNNYAYEKGFSVRKSSARYYAGTLKIRQRDFLCSKEGFREDYDLLQSRNYERLDTRTGCKAMIRFAVKEDEWTVTRFIAEHNHELASAEERHLLRSARKLTGSKAAVIKSMVNAGIRTKSAYSYIADVVGGTDNVGFTKRDCYNYVNHEKLTLIEVGDAQSLCQQFKKNRKNDFLFFDDVQLDQEGRMTNFFWRDGRSLRDYECFGDVVVFDTTYRTNRYNLICAPFVGINHHWQNIMFGCAFLLDETTQSFIWLFKTFLESMGGTAPKTIITDQDQAMAKAIEEVFPNTRHRLCQWHISKNAPSHLAGLLSNSGFRKLFYECMQSCDSDIEFEDCWMRMVEGYNCRDHSWLKNMYKIRHKWSTAFSKDTFSGGIKSSQRSESTNSVLNGMAKSTTSLTEFLLAFENFVSRWRESEAEADFRCKQGMPPLAIKRNSMCLHAAKVYTHKVYTLFENEFLDGVGTLKSIELSSLGDVCTYQVDGVMGKEKSYTVLFNSSTFDVSCTCKKFESMGLLCSHALHCLCKNNVVIIPEKYILKRWTRQAKNEAIKVNQSEISNSRGKEIELEFHHKMMRWAYDMVSISQGDEVARSSLTDCFRHGHEELRKIIANSNLDDGETREENQATGDTSATVMSQHDEPVLNPPRIKPKGVSNKRLKGHFEKRTSNTRKTTSNPRKPRKTVRDRESNTRMGAISRNPINNNQGYYDLGMTQSHPCPLYFGQIESHQMQFTRMMQNIDNEHQLSQGRMSNMVLNEAVEPSMDFPRNRLFSRYGSN